MHERNPSPTTRQQTNTASEMKGREVVERGRQRTGRVEVQYMQATEEIEIAGREKMTGQKAWT